MLLRGRQPDCDLDGHEVGAWARIPTRPTGGVSGRGVLILLRPGRRRVAAVRDPACRHAGDPLDPRRGLRRGSRTLVAHLETLRGLAPISGRARSASTARPSTSCSTARGPSRPRPAEWRASRLPAAGVVCDVVDLARTTQTGNNPPAGLDRGPQRIAAGGPYGCGNRDLSSSGAEAGARDRRAARPTTTRRSSRSPPPPSDTAAADAIERTGTGPRAARLVATHPPIHEPPHLRMVAARLDPSGRAPGFGPRDLGGRPPLGDEPPVVRGEPVPRTGVPPPPSGPSHASPSLGRRWRNELDVRSACTQTGAQSIGSLDPSAGDRGAANRAPSADCAHDRRWH